MIAGEQQAPAPPIPDGEGEHPAEPLEHPLTVVLVEMDQHLGVGPGPEPMPLPLQLLVQTLVVVDLPVQDDDDAPVLVGERLVPAGEVDDAEATHAEAHAALGERAPVIRTAVLDRIAHADDLRLGDRRGADPADDAAHLRRPASCPTPPSCTPARTE